GMDVSQKTLDVALLQVGGRVLAQVKIANTAQAIHKLLARWKKSFGVSGENALACLEATGHYSNLPVLTLLDMQVPVWLAHPTNIQKSLGHTRGKNDKIDALRIATYARLFNENARFVTEDFRQSLRLKQMITERRNLVRRKSM